MSAPNLARASNDDLRDLIARGYFRRPKAAPMSMQARLWGDEDPYEGVKPRAEFRQLRGVNRQAYPCPILGGVIAETRPRRLLEIGAFYGGNSCGMAMQARRFHDDAEVLSVDPWLGDPASWIRPKWKRKARPAFGYFRRCVVANGLERAVTYLPMRSDDAYVVCAHVGLTFDFAFIDGPHGYEAVKNDLAMWSQRLSAGAAMVCDDYEPGRFDGVVKAVDEWCAVTPWRKEIIDRKAVLRR